MIRNYVYKTCTDNDFIFSSFFRVEGGEYNSHFIVNEEDFTKVNFFYSLFFFNFLLQHYVMFLL